MSDAYRRSLRHLLLPLRHVALGQFKHVDRITDPRDRLEEAEVFELADVDRLNRAGRCSHPVRPPLLEIHADGKSPGLRRVSRRKVVADAERGGRHGAEIGQSDFAAGSPPDCLFVEILFQSAQVLSPVEVRVEQVLGPPSGPPASSLK